MVNKKWLMILCCVIPMVAVIALASRLGYGAWLLVLICPLIHILMMIGMSKRSGSSDDNRKCH